MQKIIDPFANDDARWATFELAREEESNLAMPDLASRNMGDFIRSLIPREIEPPKPEPDAGRRVLGHITGFPE